MYGTNHKGVLNAETYLQTMRELIKLEILHLGSNEVPLYLIAVKEAR